VAPEYQGWNGILHGGITSTILDEAMAKWLEYKGYNALTVEMTTKYYKNIPIGEKVTVYAWMQEEKRKKIFYMASEIRSSDNQILASAQGKYFKLNIEKLIQ
jgi:acyl-coenzyme A thioesterase PaaI-like protein